MTINFYNEEFSFNRARNKEALVATWIYANFVPRLKEIYHLKGSDWKIVEVRWENQDLVEITLG